VGISPQKFLLNPVSLAVLDTFVGDNDFVNLYKEIYMVLDYETQTLPSPFPPVHNEILGVFRNQEPGGLPGALVSVIEHSESARRANLASLHMIRGNRVQINLNLGHIPQILVRLSALTERFLNLSESESQNVDPYRVSVQGMTTEIKAQQRVLIGALLNWTEWCACMADTFCYSPTSTTF
jgi:hypothetical protein